MLAKITAVILLLAFIASPLAGTGPAAALADDTVSTQTPPVLTVHSTGGTITLVPGDESGVRVISGGGNQRARINRFDPSQMGTTHIMLPEQFVRQPYGHGYRMYRLPARQFAIPMARFGSEGVNVENPGGDTSIAVPRRMGAVFINAERGNVNIQRMHAPFIINATGGEVRMINVGGRGLIRTTTGNVILGGVGGDLHVQTVSGAVTVYGSAANSVDVQTDNGPIYYRFARCGNGVYRFHSKDGAIRLGFRPEAAAQVDAQSDTGTVQNLFATTPGVGTASVTQSSTHALSMAINGGGPEITVTTTSGDISIEPVTDPAPAKAP
jgi:Toastrack DUF4097